MESKPPQERYASYEEQPDDAPQAELDVLPAGFGFTENAALTELMTKIREAYARGDEEAVTDILTEYRIKAEDAVSQFQGADYAKAQICLDVYMGILRREVGRDYIEDLQDALTYAANMGYDDIARIIEAQLDMLDVPSDE